MNSKKRWKPSIVKQNLHVYLYYKHTHFPFGISEAYDRYITLRIRLSMNIIE